MEISLHSPLVTGLASLPLNSGNFGCDTGGDTVGAGGNVGLFQGIGISELVSLEVDLS